MKPTTILDEYERRLEGRLQRGEITESTRDTYLNDGSRVLEVLLKHLPPNVIEGYMEVEGYRSYYGHIVELLRSLARSHGQSAFPDPRKAQPRLPGVPEGTRKAPRRSRSRAAKGPTLFEQAEKGD